MRKGYTLIELMVVVAIVGTLSALVFKTVVNMKARALLGQSKANLGIIRASLNLYRVYYRTPPNRLTQSGAPPNTAEVIENPPPANLNTFGEFYSPRNPDSYRNGAGWQILPNYAPFFNTDLSTAGYQVIHTALDLTLNNPGVGSKAEGWWYTTWNGGEVYTAAQGSVTLRAKEDYYTLW